MCDEPLCSCLMSMWSLQSITETNSALEVTDEHLSLIFLSKLRGLRPHFFGANYTNSTRKRLDSTVLMSNTKNMFLLPKKKFPKAGETVALSRFLPDSHLLTFWVCFVCLLTGKNNLTTTTTKNNQTISWGYWNVLQTWLKANTPPFELSLVLLEDFIDKSLIILLQWNTGDPTLLITDWCKANICPVIHYFSG